MRSRSSSSWLATTAWAAAAAAAALLGAAASPARAGAQSRPHLAVLDFEARNVDPLLAQSLADAAAGALRELRVFRVISQAEIRQLLAVERQRELLSVGCEDSSCLAQIGNAVGARVGVVGQVMALEKDEGPLALRVRLFDMRKMEVQSDETRPDLSGPREALAATPGAALASVRPILDKEQGFLEPSCREEGAKVSIDGRLVGLTPLPSQKLGWGPHRVVVEKEGFISWAKDVRVERNQATTEHVALIPSPEPVDAYRSRQMAMRAGGWFSAAVAAAGVATALGLQLGYVEPRFRKLEPLQKGSSTQPDQLEQACRDAGRPLGGAGQSCCDHARQLSHQGASAQWGARAAAGAAAAGAGLALFFLAGDDPGRYDACRGLPGGGALAPVSITFGGPS